MITAKNTNVAIEAECIAVELEADLHQLTPELLAMVGGGDGIVSIQ